jgi:hypothetical protein
MFHCHNCHTDCSGRSAASQAFIDRRVTTIICFTVSIRGQLEKSKVPLIGFDQFFVVLLFTLALLLLRARKVCKVLLIVVVYGPTETG